MANSLIVYKNATELLLRSINRRTLVFHNIIHQTKHSTLAAEEKKKLTIRNVFKDNPAAKYWLLGALAVTGGVTYYVYNNQEKKKLVLNCLPPSPNHYCIPRDEDVYKLKDLLQDAKNGKYLKQIQISGPSGTGKTQLARLLAENINQSRKESFEFKLWPKDEVTGFFLAHSKNSLLLCLKQLAVKLDCTEDDMKLDNLDLEAQLDVFSKAVKEKLRQKSQWILIVDNHDTSKQLTKWLPDCDWGNGYVIHTMLSDDVGNSEKESEVTNYNLNQLTADSARQLFLGVVNDTLQDTSYEDPTENLLKLLHYNPLSLVYAAVYFKHQNEQNDKYSYQNLYSDLDKTVHQLNEVNPNTSELLSIQTSCVTLAAKASCESLPELVHVFDFLGSCNARHPIPLSILSCHFKTPEYHIQLKPEVELSSEGLVSSEQAASSLTVNADLESHEPSLWSLHGIVSRVLKISERIKLEIDAVKGLFGYGSAMFGAQIQQSPDELEFIHHCPLLIKSSEQMADVEVLSCHPIVHNVLCQFFLSVTIPLLEQQYLLIAQKKHQYKSYFGRLQGFDPQKAIFEYRKCLGDNVPSEAPENRCPSLLARPYIADILSGKSGEDEDDQAKSGHHNVTGHLQEHFNRVVSSFGNHYRKAGDDSSGVVAKALLLPHLQALVHETWLTPGSRGQIYQTMANIYSNILGDYTTSKRLLDEAYAVYKERYGESSIEIAGLLTQQADLYSSSDELAQSKSLLERALNIYQKDIKTSQTCKQPLEYGKTLVALGVTCGGLGESDRSKDLLEKGLMELQNAAPDDPHAKENKWFAAEISSAVTNLGHAYLSLGKINQGRKLLELALIGHQNVHGDAHTEVIRTLTTLSIAHTMQGNSQESKRLRNEAGKIQKKLDMRPHLYLS